MTGTWTVEMYTDARGQCPVERWLESLSVAKFAAIDAAIHHRLGRQGMELAGSSWLKPLKEGLYEFRVRSTAAEIVRMYGDAGHAPPEDTESILLRVFVAFHGNRVVLLLDGYDKGAEPQAATTRDHCSTQAAHGLEGAAGPRGEEQATRTVTVRGLT